ncbi:unnamed protein product [Leptidea sinapis]|uniref:Secreted protein n=1 Tax=Leptidea sinapis TaxID=189913 RepID=A0A5E4QDN9_9NEOP|nr:unnamed protein product [Leptidea sinapis]
MILKSGFSYILLIIVLMNFGYAKTDSENDVETPEELNNDGKATSEEESPSITEEQLINSLNQLEREIEKYEEQHEET